LPHVFAAKLLRLLRWARLTAFAARDRALDEVCKRLLGSDATPVHPATPNPPLPCIVAFGAANACSTGFGYAPVPQARLRHRLEQVHKAVVVLVDEFRTSQCCCACGHVLRDVYRRSEERDSQALRVGDKTLVWGVKSCRHCWVETSPGRRHRLYCHRDVNAARNIMLAYLAMAETGQRPPQLSRSDAKKRRLGKQRVSSNKVSREGPRATARAGRTSVRRPDQRRHQGTGTAASPMP
jgi:hypothetical protein